MTIASDYTRRTRPSSTDVALAASQLSTSNWRRIARLATAATVSIATIAGVSMGLAGPSVSPVAPVVAAAPATVAAAPTTTDPVITTVDAPADGDHHHGDGGRGGDRDGR